MDAALSWIGDLVRAIASIFPRLIVIQSSHGGVKYRNGRERIELKPGRHIYWPIMSPIETCAVVRQVVRTPPQVLVTADGQGVVARGVFEYEVDDVIVFLAECEEPLDALESLGMAAVKDVVTELEYEADIEQDEMDHMLLRAARESFKPYGAKPLRARLVDFAPVRAVHLTGGRVAVGGD